MPDDFKTEDLEFANGKDHSAHIDNQSAHIDKSWFSRENLTLSQDFAPDAGNEVITAVDVRSPRKHDWVRVHESENYRLVTTLFESRDDQQRREVYIVDPSLRKVLGPAVIPATLFTAVTALGEVFIWPVKMASRGGRTNKWFESALTLAQRAMTRWVRIESNMGKGSYDAVDAAENWGEPEWPNMEFTELLMIAFKELYIKELSHIVLRKWRGEIR